MRIDRSECKAGYLRPDVTVAAALSEKDKKNDKGTLSLAFAKSSQPKDFIKQSP